MESDRVDWRQEVRRRLELDMRAEREAEIVEELAQHLEQRFDALVSQGMSSVDARRAVLDSLEDGQRLSRNLARVETVTRADASSVERPVRRVRHALARDARLALRAFWRDPIFAFVSVLTLAFGISVNLSMFNVAYAVLWRPVPYRAPDRLVEIRETRPTGELSRYTSLPNYTDWRSAAKSFEGMGAYTDAGATLTGVGEPVRLASYLISASVLPLIGVEPIIGRNFVEDEDRPNGPGAVILSHHLWEQRFGADPGVAGSRVMINGELYTIVGVMPRDFQFPVQSLPVDLWTPIGRDPFPLMQLRDGRLIKVVARLQPRTEMSAAAAEMATIARHLAQAHPDTNTGWGALIVPLQEDWFGAARAPLLMLMGAVGFVLLIICCNVASLFLAKTTNQQRDLAVRRALGASRARIIQQLLVQSLVLASTGALLGVGLSVWFRGVFVSFAPPSLPRLAESRLDVQSLMFAMVAAIAAGLVIGLGPAWLSSRAFHVGDRGSGAAARHNRLLSALLVGEIAASIVLLSGAGLFVQSLLRVLSVSPGFDASNVLTVPIELPVSSYGVAARQSAFFATALDRLAGIPGVETVAAGFPLPYEGAVAFPFSIDGLSTQEERRLGAFYRAVSPGYFETLRIPLKRGRVFTNDDRASSLQVVVVNEAMAIQFFPNQDAVGRRITIVDRNAGDRTTSREIVGIVANVRHQGLDRPSGPEMYVPYRQAPSQWMTLALRTNTRRAIVSSVAREIHEVDSAVPVQNPRWLDERLAQSSAERRFNAQLLGLFAVSAVLLAMLGIAGTTIYIVVQRTPEIAIRMAIGATFSDVVRLILTGTLKVAVAGSVAGVAASLALARTIRGLLFETSPTDVSTLATVAVTMMTLALIAGLGPARHAASLDPVVALRRAE